MARKLIESHLMLVVNIAQKHAAENRSMLHLIQEGNMGLMNAIKTFAAKPAGDFPTFAAACIEAAIVQA